MASLLASEPSKSDALGREIAQELFTIFRREREEGIQPVLKEDVAEVLRRRFFKPDSIRDREAFRPHVVAALKGIAERDEETAKERKPAEERFLASFPFHPDLTEVFYTKWTQLEGFQRTRGVLRTFALALRDAVGMGPEPAGRPERLPDRAGPASTISAAARELTGIAGQRGIRGEAAGLELGILEGELGKAVRNPGRDLRPGSPRGRAGGARHLLPLPAARPAGVTPRPDAAARPRPGPTRFSCEKALLKWAESVAGSWTRRVRPPRPSRGRTARRPVPKSWRLGSKPNLNQMHHDARSRVLPS